jgi:hypothetical protein
MRGSRREFDPWSGRRYPPKYKANLSFLIVALGGFLYALGKCPEAQFAANLAIGADFNLLLWMVVRSGKSRSVPALMNPPIFERLEKA